MYWCPSLSLDVLFEVLVREFSYNIFLCGSLNGFGPWKVALFGDGALLDKV